MKKLVLSYCDFSGVWSKPYRDAGYDVEQIDILWMRDARLEPYCGRPVHGILAAPPCTNLARSGARLWREKGEPALLEAMSVVDACLRAVAIYRPIWWALENPIGRLKDYLGEPAYKFDPCDHGDPWTKRTWLWGNFNVPSRQLVAPELADITTKTGGAARSLVRSVTPSGFARAFFEANP